MNQISAYAADQLLFVRFRPVPFASTHTNSGAPTRFTSSLLFASKDAGRWLARVCLTRLCRGRLFRASRILKCGFPERFAQQALGHNSKAVHHAYSKHAEVTVPSLDDWENEWQKNPQSIAK